MNGESVQDSPGLGATSRTASTSRAGLLAQRGAPLIALAVLLYVLVATAWMADDAFITFRTVRNLWNGHGLTWNPGERVQAYTHPLWMLFASLCFGLSGECYFSVLTLAIVLSLVLAVSLMGIAGREERALGAVLVLLASASLAMAEFQVSGLETPLLTLLLVWFVASASKVSVTRGSLLVPALLSAAVSLTRIDALVLVGPILAALVFRAADKRRAFKETALGLVPLVLWEVFSLVYYGSLVPNTAVAKLNIATSRGVLLSHGVHYAVESLQRDPVTLLCTFGVILAFALKADLLARAAAFGLLSHVLYVIWIGGDFMTGRFWVPPFAAAIGLLASQRFNPIPGIWRSGARLGVLAAAVCAYALVWPNSPWHFDLHYGQGATIDTVVDDYGVANEREYYYAWTGLMPVLVNLDDLRALHAPIPPEPSSVKGREMAHTDALSVRMAIGFFGYFVGDHQVVDLAGLADAFLARIPHCVDKFRAGHCRRALPDGYIASRMQGTNLVVDPELAVLYARVQRVIAGPLFDVGRWQAIACLNFGFCREETVSELQH